MNTGPYIGEFAYYLANYAQVKVKSNEKIIAYTSAAGYLGAINNLLLDTYKSDDRVSPKQFQTKIWKQYMMKLRTTKWELCRREKVPLLGSKESAIYKDCLGMFAVCLWSGTLANDEF